MNWVLLEEIAKACAAVMQVRSLVKFSSSCKMSFPVMPCLQLDAACVEALQLDAALPRKALAADQGCLLAVKVLPWIVQMKVPSAMCVPAVVPVLMRVPWMVPVLVALFGHAHDRDAWPGHWHLGACSGDNAGDNNNAHEWGSSAVPLTESKRKNPTRGARYSWSGDLA